MFPSLPTDLPDILVKKLTSILVTIALVPHFVSYYKKYTGSNKIYITLRAHTFSPQSFIFFLICKKYKRLYNLIHYRKRWTRNGCIYNAVFFFLLRRSPLRLLESRTILGLRRSFCYCCFVLNFTLFPLFQATLLCMWVRVREKVFFTCLFDHHYNS